jgi:hypothetical protein
MVGRHCYPALFGIALASIWGGGMGLLFLPLLAVPVLALAALYYLLKIAWLCCRRSHSALFLAFVAMCVSCYDPHAQESAIVRFVELHGAGNISTYSSPGLQQWFGERPELATRVHAMCGDLYKTSNANWATTAEGTTCLAARSMAPVPTIQSDGRSW